MQLIKAPRDALLKPLATVSGIVERRHTLPILANILIRKEGERVSFVSTDIEVQIRTHADIGVGSESFATTVAARKLLDILRALPESGEVTLSHTAKKMTVQSGKSRFNLQTLAAEDFPTVSQPESYLASFSLPQKTLKHLIAMVHFSMAQQDIRYYLNGLLLVVDGGQVIAVATDGHRLAYCAVRTDATSEAVDGATTDEPTESESADPAVMENAANATRMVARSTNNSATNPGVTIDGTAPSGRHEVIVPRKSILELQRLLGDGDDLVTIDLAANQVRFTFGAIELISKLVEGKFPDYQRVIPSGYTKSFEIGRDDWLRALQRVAILTSDKFKGVRFVLSEDAVKISSTNADQEDAQDEIEVAYPHGTLDIGFNVSYLLDVLNNLKTDKVTVSVGDSNSSALITLPQKDDFKYVVMPMRI